MHSPDVQKFRSLRKLAGRDGPEDETIRDLDYALETTARILAFRYDELKGRRWTAGKRDRALLSHLMRTADRAGQDAISRFQRDLLPTRAMNHVLKDLQDNLILATLGAIRQVFGQRVVTRRTLLGRVLPDLLKRTAIGRDINWNADALLKRIGRRGGEPAIRLASVFPLSIDLSRDKALRACRPKVVIAERDFEVSRETGRRMWPGIYVWLREHAPKRWPRGLRPAAPEDPLAESSLSFWQEWAIREQPARPGTFYASVLHGAVSKPFPGRPH